jgi:hypothetical protein
VFGLGDDWAETSVELPQGEWRNVFTGDRTNGGPVDIATLLQRFPVAVFERAGPERPARGAGVEGAEERGLLERSERVAEREPGPERPARGAGVEGAEERGLLERSERVAERNAEGE